MLVYHMNKPNPTRVNLLRSRFLGAQLIKLLSGRVRAMCQIPLISSLRRPSSPGTSLYAPRVLSFARFVATVSLYHTKLILCFPQERRQLSNCVAHIKEYSNYDVWASTEALCGKSLQISGFSADSAAEGMVNMMQGHRQWCTDCNRVMRVNLIPQYRPPQ